MDVGMVEPQKALSPHIQQHQLKEKTSWTLPINKKIGKKDIGSDTKF
jgi:hypothetical protein